MNPSSKNLSNSCLYATLYGFREMLDQQLELKNVPVVVHDNAKNALRKKIQEKLKSGLIAYPYGFIEIASVEINRDLGPIKQIQRSGYLSNPLSATDATVLRGFLFPAKLSVVLHYINSDVEATLLFAESIALISILGGLDFTINYGQEFKWCCRVLLDGPVTIPKKTLEDPSLPAEDEIVISGLIETRIGFTRPIAKINNQGAPTFFFELKNKE